MLEKRKASRIIGIDFGLARLGVAISDESKIIATPMMTFKASEKSEETVKRFVKELNDHQFANNYEIAEIVVGLPLLMSGKKGFLADETNHFVGLLKEAAPYPVVTWDERLTSVQAERSMREGSMTRKKRSQRIDEVAAVIILQNYLDYKIREVR